MPDTVARARGTTAGGGERAFRFPRSPPHSSDPSESSSSGPSTSGSSTDSDDLARKGRKTLRTVRKHQGKANDRPSPRSGATPGAGAGGYTPHPRQETDGREVDSAEKREREQTKALLDQAKLRDIVTKEIQRDYTQYDPTPDGTGELATLSRELTRATTSQGDTVTKAFIEKMGLEVYLALVLTTRVQKGDFGEKILSALDSGTWRQQNLKSTSHLVQRLAKMILKEDALTHAEAAFENAKWKSGESALAFGQRLTTLYFTAALKGKKFKVKYPYHCLPERLMRAVMFSDKSTYRKVKSATKLQRLYYKESHLKRYGLTGRVEVDMAMKAVTEELSHHVDRERSHEYRPKPAQGYWGGKTRYPAKGSANVMRASEDEADQTDEETLAVVTRPPTPPRSTSLAKAAVGLKGPAYVPTAETRNGGKGTLGHPKYTGCYNCQSQDHRANQCPHPPSKEVTAYTQGRAVPARKEARMMLTQGAVPRQSGRDSRVLQRICLAQASSSAEENTSESSGEEREKEDLDRSS